MHSSFKNSYLLNLPPRTAQTLKLALLFPRYYSSLIKGKLQSKKFGKEYRQKTLFIAGLPKSGTTWLERMLTSYPGITPILPYEATIYEMTHKSSCEYDFGEKMLDHLKGGLFLIKMHSHGSAKNVARLGKNGIKYCIIYRDLRDIAVSLCFYVKRNPFHPENQRYRNLSVNESLKYFCQTRLDEYANWIRSWQKNRSIEDSVVITYEELRNCPFATFTKVLRLFQLNASDEKTRRIIDNYSVSKKKDNKGKNSEAFFRKGITGDWKNYFDEELKRLVKDKVGDFLVELGYEKDLNW